MRAHRATRGWPVAVAVTVMVVIAAPPPARAEQVFNTDLVVLGSSCVGTACAPTPDFGSDTLILKQPDVRLRFEDTSNSASFPTHDWRILVNDADGTPGGRNRFSILDDTAGTTPFTILGGAPTDSLVVDANGNVGIGTATPGAKLEIAGDVVISGTVTAPGLTLPSLLSIDDLTTGAVSAADAEVNGGVGVGGDLVVGGTVNGRDLAADGALLDTLLAEASVTKAGIIPIAEFSRKRPTATVTFETPYGPDESYVVAFTVVSGNSKKAPVPHLTAKDAGGFTVALGTRKAGPVTEVQWLARPVGE